MPRLRSSGVVYGHRGESVRRTGVRSDRPRLGVVGFNEVGDSELAQPDGRGTITVTWLQRALLSNSVLVDGKVIGRVRFAHPMTIEVTSGDHEVVIRSRPVKTPPVRVAVSVGGRSDLYGGMRAMPHGMGYRQSVRWGRRESMWLSEEATAPALEDSAYQVRNVSPRRWVLLIASILFFAAVTTAQAVGSHYGRAAIGSAGVIVGVIIAVGWTRRTRQADGSQSIDS
jgi:hypothetical protein